MSVEELDLEDWRMIENGILCLEYEWSLSNIEKSRIAFLKEKVAKILKELRK